jgi:hypothetical protein
MIIGKLSSELENTPNNSIFEIRDLWPGETFLLPQGSPVYISVFDTQRFEEGAKPGNRYFPVCVRNPKKKIIK